MKLFECEVCGHQLYFESSHCMQCENPLGYLVDEGRLRVLEEEPDGGRLRIEQSPKTRAFRICLNGRERDACNWLVDEEADTEYCQSCALSEIIPDLSDPKNLRAWKRLEAAKRRLLFTLFGLGLPVVSKARDSERGLLFRFMHSTPNERVMSGHAEGVVTLNAAEADHAYREDQREQLGEKYRTPLGHLRHEVGHYYFSLLVREPRRLESFRALFGDERESYDEALKRHYDQGPPDDWADRYISAYATMHPWEDWAESFAHYLHMVDMLQTAQSYGLAVREPTAEGPATLAANEVSRRDFAGLIQAFTAVSLALNGLNRSMGLTDAYPFAISPKAREKLAFVHESIEEQRWRH